MEEQIVIPKSYKPSGLDYFEITLIVVCLLLHFVPWLTLSVGGNETFSFIPFKIFGSAITMLVVALFAVTVIMRFVGRFSGMTLMVVMYLSALAYACNFAMQRLNRASEYIGGLLELGRGLSNSFSMGEGAPSGGAQTVELGGAYLFMAIIIGVIAFLMFASWVISMCRLASLPRKELTKNYYIGIIGYFLIGVVAVIAMLVATKDIGVDNGWDGLMSGMASVFIVGTGTIVMSTMLAMLVVNIIVVVITQLLLRGRNNRLMAIIALVLAAVAMIIYLVINTAISKSNLPTLPNSIDELIALGEDYALQLAALLLLRAFVLVALITCLLRAVYFFFYAPKAVVSSGDALLIGSEETPPMEKPDAGVDQPIVDIVRQPSSGSETGRKVQPKRRLYWIGGAVAVAIIGCVLLLLHTCGGNKNLFNIEPPQWEKFVMVTAEDVTLYQKATTGSPTLMMARENIDSDMCDFQFRWSDQGKKRGYTVFAYELRKNEVLPVLAETENWYRVHLESEFCGAIVVNIQKKYCKEVKPAPITADVLRRVDKQLYRCDAIIKKGKLKGLCLSTQENILDGEECGMGQLIDRTLFFPEHHSIWCSNNDSEVIGLDKEQGTYPVCKITYGPNHVYALDGQSLNVLDTHLLTPQQVEQIYNDTRMDAPSYVTAVYYFPDADPDRLFSFTYSKNGYNDVGDADDRVQEGLKNFTVEENDGIQQLVAELDEEKVFAGVENYEVTVYLEEDFDDDGYNEAIVYEWGGGNGVEPPYIVYYDKDTQKFGKTDGFEDLIDNAENIKVEQWEGKKAIQVKVGLRTDYYLYENRQIHLAERGHADVGERFATISISQVYEEEEYDEKTIAVDINGDGIPEYLTFVHDGSHMLNWGKDMQLVKVSGNGWDFPDNGHSIGPIGRTFTFLKSSSDGVLPDLLLCDEAWLYKWNGELYQLVTN